MGKEEPVSTVRARTESRASSHLGSATHIFLSIEAEEDPHPPKLKYLPDEGEVS